MKDLYSLYVLFVLGLSFSHIFSQGNVTRIDSIAHFELNPQTAVLEPADNYHFKYDALGRGVHYKYWRWNTDFQNWEVMGYDNYRYDNDNRLIEQEEFKYDLNINVRELSGRKTRYSYNQHGKVDSLLEYEWSENNGAPVWILKIRNTILEFDSMQRVKRKLYEFWDRDANDVTPNKLEMLFYHPNGHGYSSHVYQYDDNGIRHFSDSTRFEFTIDGKPIRTIHSNDSINIDTALFTYDASGRLVTFEFKPGHSGFGTQHQYTYNSIGDLTSYVENHWLGGFFGWYPYFLQEYTYDYLQHRIIDSSYYYDSNNLTRSLQPVVTDQFDPRFDDTKMLTTPLFYANWRSPSIHYIKNQGHLSYSLEHTGTTLTDSTHYYYSAAFPLRLEDEIEGSQVQVFPNPVSDAFSLRFSETPQEAAPLTLYDMHGRIAKQLVYFPGKKISCSNLSAGIYVGEIVFGGKKATFQLLKR